MVYGAVASGAARAAGGRAAASGAARVGGGAGKASRERLRQRQLGQSKARDRRSQSASGAPSSSSPGGQRAFRRAGQPLQARRPGAGGRQRIPVDRLLRGLQTSDRRRDEEDEEGRGKQAARYAAKRFRQGVTAAATGQRTQDAGLLRQALGEVGAWLGRLIGALFGGVGAPIGQRIGRFIGENPIVSSFIIVGGLIFNVLVMTAPIWFPLTVILILWVVFTLSCEHGDLALRASCKLYSFFGPF